MARAAGSASTRASSPAASRPTSAAGWRPPSTRAEALSEAHAYEEALDEFEQSPARSSGPARPSSRCARSPARPGRGCSTGEVRAAIELLDARAGARRGSGVLRRRPRGRAVPPRRLPLQALEHLDGGRPLRRGADARRALGAAVRPLRSNILRLALALLPAPARLRGRARGRRARARARRGARRPPRGRPTSLPGLARRRAQGPLAARPHVRRAGEGPVRGARRPGEPSAGC